MAPGVWVARTARWLTNSTLVVGDDGACLVVDPALSCAELRGLADAISRHGWRVVAGFATHPHFDHLLWAPELGPVPRYATADCVATARAEAAALSAEASAEVLGLSGDVRTDLVALPRAGRVAVPWEGPAVEVVAHRGHAAGHAALWLPSVRVLLAGDMLSDTEVPLLDVDAADPVGDYREALSRLERYVALAEVLVPGHGHVARNEQVAERPTADREYLDALVGAPQRADVDVRLKDPEMREQHERQAAVIRAG